MLLYTLLVVIMTCDFQHYIEMGMLISTLRPYWHALLTARFYCPVY
jgi:hypothetical protein